MHWRISTRVCCQNAAIGFVALAVLLLSGRAELIAQSAPSLTVTPTTIGIGGSVTVAVANGPGNTGDWVGLYSASAPDTSMLDWKYLNGSRVAPVIPVTSATLTFAMPSTTGA